MLSILDRALSWTITSFGNKFCLKKRSRLIKALDNRFYVKFMQLEISLFYCVTCKNNKFPHLHIQRSDILLRVPVLLQKMTEIAWKVSKTKENKRLFEAT